MRGTAIGFLIAALVAGTSARAGGGEGAGGSSEVAVTWPPEPTEGLATARSAGASPEAADASGRTPGPGAESLVALEPTRSRAGRTWEVLRGDYSQFYSARALAGLGAGLLVAGAIANTDADQEAYDWYHGEVGTGADPWADGADQLGEPAVGLGGALLGVALLGMVPPGENERPAAAWVRRTARGYLVGLPALYYLQQVVGSGRPDEPEGSRWQVFGESHGVSGHAFLAAVPLLTLARTADNRLVQGSAFLASVATAWARVHQEKHYPSQAFLGWYLAWTATGAVARNDAAAPEPRWAVTPVLAREGGGLVVRASF
jgi:hypothetical protein